VKTMAENVSPPSPTKDTNPHTRPLRRGDLVRVSEAGAKAEKRLKDRDDALGRIAAVSTDSFTVEWIVLGGSTPRVSRDHLVHTTAQNEGMTEDAGRRRRRPPSQLDMSPEPKAKREKKEENATKKETKTGTKRSSSVGPKKKQQQKKGKNATTETKTKRKPAKNANGIETEPGSKGQKKPAGTTQEIGKKGKQTPSGSGKAQARKTEKPKTGGAGKQRAKPEPKEEDPDSSGPPAENDNNNGKQAGLTLYEKHRREFERVIARHEKIDRFGWFWDEAPEEFDEKYGENEDETNATFPNHAPFNWEMIRKRRQHGRYVLNREKLEEEERFSLLEPYYAWRGKRPKRRFQENSSFPASVVAVQKLKKRKPNKRVSNPQGVHWDLYAQDVLAMIESALERNSDENDTESLENKQGVHWAAHKVRDGVLSSVEKIGQRHEREMREADDRHKFALVVDKATNNEAAMQSWRKHSFPERKYERLKKDRVCAGLSELDERIASHELKTGLDNSFIGVSYRYDDTGQSEAWMKSVVDETELKSADNDNAKNSSRERQAALAMAGDEGVRRAQVTATMNSLIMGVEDRVMTQQGVLVQPELRSANWLSSGTDDASGLLPCSVSQEFNGAVGDAIPLKIRPDNSEVSYAASSLNRSVSDQEPELVEQPVWGLDCYTRRNVTMCLESELDSETSIAFVEKWLLPAINACPVELAHDIKYATLLLEGLPFHEDKNDDDSNATGDSKLRSSVQEWTHTILGNALLKKIKRTSAPYIKAAAQLLRRARTALGLDFFRIHPKGHGSVLLAERVKPNTLVTFYRGEIYPPWRWCEKMDAIDITQRRKNLKPALPDFYNMTMERPQTDPRGYGNLIVDASRKAGHGSSLSHSCDPTCEVRVSALNGELCLAMTTLRELEIGEELTFNYNASTDSLQEYRSAICLCGKSNCRGSFLHFATADCYQQVLNRNSPIATRFANLVKGCTKQVMSDEDDRILKNHGFLTAVFGAVAVNRRESCALKHGSALLDSLDFVPIWLKTYVADVLRYVEYERRALPIALICEQSKEGKESHGEILAGDHNAQPDSGFPFFIKSQADIILEAVKKENPDCSDSDLASKTRKLGANLWRELPADKRQRWQVAAREDFEKRQNGKVVPADQKSRKQQKTIEKLLGREDDGLASLISNEFEFQEADSEGMNAMSQRVQQLTAVLSRVGRVLDRHRESHLATMQSDPDSADALRDSIPPPLWVLSEEEVVDWLWNSGDGVLVPFLRRVESAKFVRPSLIRGILEIRLRYGELEQIGSLPTESPLANGASARSVLNEALLELRSLILDELQMMAKEFRQRKKPTKETPQSAQEVKIDNDAKESTANLEGAVEADNEAKESSTTKSSQVEPSENLTEIDSVMQDMLKEVERRSSCDAEGVSKDDKIPASDKPRAKNLSANTTQEDEPWIAHYSDRFMLQVSADVLLMYASTSNFFSATSYECLESSPIEIYARELGNSVPRSVIDTDVAPSVSNAGEQLVPRKQKKATRPKTEEFCSPADVVAEVKVRYEGDYVLSQLLQWYNGGMGQKAGLPHLAGSVCLPSIDACWASKLAAKRRTRVLTRTHYEVKLRPQLVEWMQDPYKRGDPWPAEVDEAFSSTTPSLQPSDIQGEGASLRFGSPVLDFLVSGDESGIFAVLDGLDADNKVSSSAEETELLTSVDRGRPAQAVCRWVQCEHPNCLKWRRVPWHVDLDLLPDQFFCELNVWDKSKANCNSNEDDWDKDDKIVGSDGKVEGSPIRKKQFSSPSHESSFQVGSKFDVLRQVRGSKKFCIATVTHVDFSGKVKRVKFHYSKTTSDCDEWIPFGSKRIAPLHSKTTPVSKKRKPGGSDKDPAKVTKFFTLPNGSKTKSGAADQSGSKSHKSDQKDESHHLGDLSASVAVDGTKTESSQEGKNAAATKVANPTEATPSGKFSGVKRRQKKEKFTDPSDSRSFNKGSRFDVLRTVKGAKKWVVATVVDFDFVSDEKRVRFHYRKSTPEQDDWIPFGSSRIAPLFSKTPTPKPKKRKSSLVDGESNEALQARLDSTAEPAPPLNKKNKATMDSARSKIEKEAALALLTSHAGAIVGSNHAEMAVRTSETFSPKNENANSAEGKFGSLLRVASDLDEPQQSPSPTLVGEHQPSFDSPTATRKNGGSDIGTHTPKKNGVSDDAERRNQEEALLGLAAIATSPPAGRNVQTVGDRLGGVSTNPESPAGSLSAWADQVNASRAKELLVQSGHGATENGQKAVTGALSIQSAISRREAFRAEQEALLRLAQQQASNQVLEQTVTRAQQEQAAGEVAGQQQQDRHLLEQAVVLQVHRHGQERTHAVQHQALELAIHAQRQEQERKAWEQMALQAQMGEQQHQADQRREEMGRHGFSLDATSAPLADAGAGRLLNSETNDALGCLMMLASASAKAADSNDISSRQLLPPRLGRPAAYQDNLGQQVANPPLAQSVTNMTNALSGQAIQSMARQTNGGDPRSGESNSGSSSS